MIGGARAVLHVHTLPWIGGSGLNTFLSMKLLDPKRFRPSLACAPGGRLEDLVRSAGITFHPIRHLRAELSPLHDSLAAGELAVVMRRLKPDIVHTHNSKAGFLGRLAGRLVRGPRIVHTVHGFSFHDSETPLRRRLFRDLERVAFRWSDAHIVISPALALWAEREGIGRASDYEHVVSGIDVDSFSNADRAEGRRLLGLDTSVLAIGLVSKLWEGKGHRFAMRVLEPVLGPRVKLVFIGEGPLEAELRAAAPRHVLFAGFQENAAAVTKALDIAILPSDFEGMGRVLLEAQAAGVPVVANRVGGTSDVVRTGGILLQPGDEVSWRGAVASLVADEALRRRLGESGRHFVTEEYSANRMVMQLEAIYDRLLGQG